VVRILSPESCDVADSPRYVTNNLLYYDDFVN